VMQRMTDDEFGKIKIRQPLSELTYSGNKLDGFYEQIIADEVNVKKVRLVDGLQYGHTKFDVEGNWIGSSADNSIAEVKLYKKISPELKREGLSREIIRAVQAARKAANLNVDGRIILELQTLDETLQKAIDEWRETIMAETLAIDMLDVKDDNGFVTTVKIDDSELKIALIKAEK